MSVAALRYAWVTFRREMLLFPAALFACFVLIAWMMRDPAIRFAIARGYLGFFVPLTGGILAAYALLDDPALELRLSTPVGAGRTLATRLGLILAIEAACALSFQAAALAMGVDFAPLGGALAVQLAWLVPTAALMSLGTLGSLATAQCATGAFVAGIVWLIQLLLKGWMLQNVPRLYLFMGVLEPGSPFLTASQSTVLAASLVSLAASWLLLRRPERYL